MKKYIYGLLAVLSVAAISACGEKEGSEPGNDSNPFISIPASLARVTTLIVTWQ